MISTLPYLSLKSIRDSAEITPAVKPAGGRRVDVMIAEPEVEELAYEEGREAVHNWFGLSYSSYLVLPRVLLEAMPGEFQQRFVACLEELQAIWDGHKIKDSYTVYLRNNGGKFDTDPLQNYRHPDREYIESLKRVKDE